MTNNIASSVFALYISYLVIIYLITGETRYILNLLRSLSLPPVIPVISAATDVSGFHR